MTDNEIIKALKDKIEFKNFDENEYAIVDIEKLKNTLDLINRQKAEIERLTEKYKHLDASIEKIQMTTKAEAIKEVTAELYNSFAQYETYDRLHTFEILDRINSVEEFLLNNPVNEMVGDNE